MNTPREGLGKMVPGEARASYYNADGAGPCEQFISEFAVSWHDSDPVTMNMTRMTGMSTAALVREDAIEAAKEILIAYNVPFCNRVSDDS